jgi:L,D-transpeptidase ErfK/SrfK
MGSIIHKSNKKGDMKVMIKSMKSTVVILLMVLLTLSNTALTTEYYNKKLCSNPEYTCIKVKPGYTWDKLFPDPRKQAIVKKVNRMNVQLTPGMMIALPNNLEQDDSLRFAPFPIRVTPLGRTVIIVDLEDAAFAAYDTFGSLVYWGPISAGKGWCSDIGRGCHTPTGTYYVQSKGGRYCYSSKYPLPDGGAPMPYCMYFHGGFALHASSTVPGYNASHGCVRLFYEDAEWLNKNFVETGTKSTQVIVRP